jgi:hypothetical protein
MNARKTASADVPQALREVWEWKDAVYRRVRDLPPEEAVRAILVRAAATVRKHGVWAEGARSEVKAVAEGRTEYGKKE